LLDQLGAALGPDALAAQQDLEDVPSYLRNELLFPYTAGMQYACRLYTDGGWPAVDAAYEALPQTSAEILYAERAGFTPLDASDVGDPGDDWDLARRDTFGAAPLLWLLQAPGGDEGEALDRADEAARALAGGELALYTNGSRSALGLSLVDDTGGDTLCRAAEEWYQAAFDTSVAKLGGDTVLEGDGQVGVLRCDGDDIRLGIAPDQATASALVS
jgi:hypothetical protein